MVASDEFVDTTVANLKILGMLQKNDKVSVRKGHISIDRGDSATGMQSLRRWFHRDSREVTVIHLRNTVNNAIRIARSLLDATRRRSEMDLWALKTLVGEMQAAEVGLQNLRITYMSDSSVAAAVDVIRERLRAHSDDINACLAQELIATETAAAMSLAAITSMGMVQPSAASSQRPLMSNKQLAEPMDSPGVTKCDDSADDDK